MKYEIIIHIQTQYAKFNTTKHCHTLADASRTFRYYVGGPNVTDVLLFQNSKLIWEWQKGGINDECL